MNNYNTSFYFLVKSGNKEIKQLKYMNEEINYT